MTRLRCSYVRGVTFHRTTIQTLHSHELAHHRPRNKLTDFQLTSKKEIKLQLIRTQSLVI
jgi:hypothetical protein